MAIIPFSTKKKQQIKVVQAQPTQTITGVVEAQPKARIIPFRQEVKQEKPDLRSLLMFPKNEVTANSTPAMTTGSTFKKDVIDLASTGLGNIMANTTISGRDQEKLGLTLEDRKKALKSGPVGSVGYETTLKNQYLIKNPSDAADVLSIGKAKTAFEFIAKTRKAKEIAPVLSKIGVPEENILILSKQLEKVTDPKKIQGIISNFTPKVPVNVYQQSEPGAFPKSLRQAEEMEKTPLEKAGFKVQPVLAKAEDPLIQEARKYKSAEEFAKSIEPNFIDDPKLRKAQTTATPKPLNSYDPKTLEEDLFYNVHNTSAEDIARVKKSLLEDDVITIYRSSGNEKLYPGTFVSPFETVAKGYEIPGTRQLREYKIPKKDLSIDTISGDLVYTPNGMKNLSDLWKKANEGTFPKNLLEADPQAGFAKVPDTIQPANYEKFFKEDTEKLFKSNIRVDKFQVTEEGQSNLARIIEENKNFTKQRRGVQSVEETERLAQEIAPKLKIKKGTALNAEELQAMGDTVAGLQTRVSDLSKTVAEGKNTDDNILALAQAKEELTFALSSLSGATAEAGRSLNILKNLRKAGASKDSKLIQEAIKLSGGRETAETIARRFVELGDDNLAKLKFLQDISKVSVPEKIYEVWLNSILSNPVTHEVNFVGNLLNAIMRVPTRAVQSGFDSKVYLSEVPHQVVGAIEGLRFGVQKALYVWRNGINPSQVSKLDIGSMPAIKGKTGTVIRLPTRLLGMMDEFFKAVVGTSEMRSLAYRTAKNEGLKGDEAIRRMHELIENPTEELYNAVDFAQLNATFQQPLGKTGKAIMQLRDKAPGIKYIIPFIKTPTNIAKEAVKTSPLGFINVLKKSKMGEYTNLPANEKSRELAQAMVGSVISIPIVMSALEGDITGAAPTNANERDAFYRKGMQPYSIKVGDKWYSYRRVEPLATVIGSIADFTQVSKEEGLDEAAKGIATTIGRNLNDKTFLSGISSFIEALTDDEKRSQWVNRTAEGLVPFSGLRRFAAQATDSTIRKPEGLWETIKSNTPGLSKSVPERFDNFGQPSKRNFSQSVSPIGITQEKEDKVEQELTKLNITIGAPSKTIAGQELTREEYQRYQKTSGRILKDVLVNLTSNPEWEKLNDRQKEVVIDRATNKVREKVKTSLFPLKSKASEIKKRIQEKGYTSEQAEEMTKKIIEGQVSK